MTTEIAPKKIPLQIWIAVAIMFLCGIGFIGLPLAVMTSLPEFVESIWTDSVEWLLLLYNAGACFLTVIFIKRKSRVSYILPFTAFLFLTLTWGYVVSGLTYDELTFEDDLFLGLVVSFSVLAFFYFTSSILLFVGTKAKDFFQTNDMLTSEVEPPPPPTF